MSTTKQTKPNANQRAALREQRERQAAAQRRLSRIVRTTWIAGITAIAVLIGVMVWAVAGNRSATPAPSSGAVVAPANATDTGALRFGTGGVGQVGQNDQDVHGSVEFSRASGGRQCRGSCAGSGGKSGRRRG